MLACPLFTHSKRYPSLLRYVVEKTLDGAAGELKERTLGICVFGREPNYDTALDPVVRATAAEIRKRIAQYYQEPGREQELRISLSPGSYVPDFSYPVPHVAPPSALPTGPVVLPAQTARTGRVRDWRMWAGVLVAGLTVIGVAAFSLRPALHKTALERFWAPVLESPDSVLLCLGQRRFLGVAAEPGQEAGGDLNHVQPPATKLNPSQISLFQLYYMGSQNAALPDVNTFGLLAALLRTHGKSYRMMSEYSTTFGDLRDGPVVLIGGFNNDWTMRLMGPMRYAFRRENDVFWIQDRQNPTARQRSVSYSSPYLNVTHDYALISRVLETRTNRMAVVVGGLTGYGTMAAGEFLSEPAYMDAFAKQAPSGWDRKNMQILIETEVINGISGPPRVAERYFW